MSETVVATNPNMVFCRGCGKSIHNSAIACPTCGAQQASPSTTPAPPVSASAKRILPVFLLCWFLGFIGVHRFFVGKIGTGILMIVTFGGLGIWWLIDFIVIICGNFTDKDGNKINLWT
jgi:TM2 domain-containing membrane protein YozV